MAPPKLVRMVRSIPTGGVAAAAACVLAGALTSACAGAVPAERAPPTRVMVKLVRASEDFAAIADEAARVAGVAVRHAAATSARWHALALDCAPAAACDAAIARLRAATAVYEAVEVEGRKTRAVS